MSALGLQSVSGVTLGPPLAIAITALVVLIADLIVPPAGRGLRERVSTGLSLIGVFVALGWAGWLAASGPRATFCSAAGGSLPGPAHAGLDCFYVTDGFTAYLQILVLAAIAVVLLLSRPALGSDRLPPGEFGFLVLASLTGMLVLPAARDLITLLVALEVVSLPAFVLVGLRRGDPRSGQAALTYFVFSVVSTALTIYGIALMYGVSGGVTFHQVFTGLGAVVNHSGDHRAPLAAAATILVTVGFSFKIAAVPFHAWAPDTYQGAPLPIAAMLSTASKGAGFAGLTVLLFHALGPEASVWGPVVAALAVASMTIGNVVALRQWHAVRLLAWSTVAQAGYLLVPLAVAATEWGRAFTLHEGVQAMLGYLGIYVAMNLGAFAVLAAVAQRRPRLAIADLRGLARNSPWLAAAVALFFTALAGLPPGVAGLFAKVVILQAAVSGHLTWLAVIAAVNTVIGLAYYLRVAALPFLGARRLDPDADGIRDPEPEGGGPTGKAAAAAGGKPSQAVATGVLVAAAATVFFSVYPQPLLRAAGTAADPVTAPLTAVHIVVGPRSFAAAAGAVRRTVGS